MVDMTLFVQRALQEMGTNDQSFCTLRKNRATASP